MIGEEVAKKELTTGEAVGMKPLENKIDGWKSAAIAYSVSVYPQLLIVVAIEQVGSIIIREVEQEVKLVVGVKKELEKLKSNLMAIRGVLADAEERQLKEIAVKQWLDKLNAVSYDMDDVLDEWSTAIFKSQVEGEDHNSASNPNSKRNVLSLIKSSCFCFKEVGLRHDIAHRIKELNETLNDIKVQKDMFGFDIGKGTTKKSETLITTSLINITEVQSREQEKNQIVNLLLSESSQSASLDIVAMVGMGGIGKTTLAQLAFNHHQVISCFNVRMWVCVSRPFDSLRISKAILESLFGDAHRFGELETVVNRIEQTIRGKKFLLVLDDMWDDGPEKWMQLKHCLLGGLPGSKILVTTRSESVARNMGCARNGLIQLGKLPLQECWSIFSQIAFFDRDTEEREQLEIIGKEIVEKCDGLPLAAKALGSLLRLKSSAQDWRDVLNSKLWEIPGIWEANSGLASLWLSYYDLPLELRHCFSYCAIFPKSYKIDKNNLIDMWMAQGYLGATSTKKNAKRCGEENFQDLIRRCFFQDLEKNGFGVNKCRMHDILHDFSMYLTKNELFSMEVENSDEKIEQSLSREARHLRIVLGKESSFPSSISTMKNLRTLWIQSHGTKHIGATLSNVFDKCIGLRSLILRSCDVSEIPSSINNLIHLRQLDLSSNHRLRRLPENVCELYNLQTLDVGDCKFVKLPERVENLVNLRQLYNFGTKFLPKAVGRLTNLTTLTEFIISNDTETACSLRDLNNLNQLQGELVIRGLGNVRSVSEAKEAQLIKKTQIIGLDLFFNGEETECREKMDEEIIEAIKPCPNVEKLRIVDYRGTTLVPSWLFLLNNLRELSLKCSNYEHLPPLWKLPSLESLCLDEMTGIKRLGSDFVGISAADHVRSQISSSTYANVAFRKLSHLSFYWIWNWEDWESAEMSNLDVDITVMPCLRNLTVMYCPELKALPDYLLRLKTLEEVKIHECPIIHEDYKQQKYSAEKWQNPNIRISCLSVSNAERNTFLANAVLEDPGTGAPRELDNKFKHKNDELAKEVERLQADRYTEAEELKYLRWINACLRHELRNVQLPPVVKGGSESMSPQSKEKAKQLILEYADGEVMNNSDWDDSDGSSTNSNPTKMNAWSTNRNPNREKFLGKLKRLVEKKDMDHHNDVPSGSKSEAAEDSDSPRGV
ncbi:putative disease resistance protein RGA3 [Mercurialis annua]|uniref:putative disease resistance protein RGA3 n=1 Tax=Mercurialis annua TaxID=3986 RepID=UPI00215FA81F|nr:putative disease resistance protein RGA3 [Mercurialis annua]